MGQPSITGNPQNILVTAGDVLVDDGVTPVDLGFISKISINIKELTTEVHTDQAGKSVVDDRFVGNDISVEMEIDELTAQRLKEAYTFGALVGTPPNAKLTWGRNIGGSYFSLAKKLIIRPTVDDTTFLGRNFTFWKATPIGDSKISYTPDNKATIKVKFRVYPDFTQTNNQYFGYFGDNASGTLTPAAAGSPTPGGGNVGGGTVGSISVSDAFTKTETWTLTCIKAVAAGGLFSVVGSVTGARGVATVGTAFHSNSIVPANSEINFTISDGSPDFSVGDTFTIATTAANYS